MKIDFTKNKFGFSLLELVVSIFIFSMIATATLSNFRQGERSSILNLSAQNLMSILRRAQFWSLTGKTIDFSGQQIVPAGGYGVRVEQCFNPPCDVFLFADFDGELDYDTNEKIDLETYSLPKDITFSTVSPYPQLDLVFKPPLPVICINRDCSNEPNSFIRLTNTKTNDYITLKINQETGEMSIEKP